MARPAEVVVDETPLDGDRIDVPTRIGWLLRISRQAAGVSLTDMARSIGCVSVALLSRLERGAARNGVVVDAYEEALGLATGQLRAPIDQLCRLHRGAPVDEAPGLRGGDALARFDRTVATVMEGTPAGGDWLRFAREHQSPDPFGLSSTTMRPLLDRLAGEMGRSVGTAFVTRKEALCRLRCSPYGGLVGDLAREMAADPDVQVHVDLGGIVAEAPTRRVLDWAATILTSPSYLAARGAALAIERMVDIGGLTDEDLLSLTPTLVEAVRAAGDDDNRRAMLSSLLFALPAAVRRGVRAEIEQPLPRPRVPASWTPTMRNTHFVHTAGMAAEACQQLGLPEQPMLTRLLFEVLYDFRSTRAVSAAFLLIGSPFAEPLQAVLQEEVLAPNDEVTRAGALATGANMPMSWDALDADAWLATGRPDVLAWALVVAGQSGVRLDGELLSGCLDQPLLRDRAIYSAGMAGHPVLRDWAADERRSPRVRRGAGWWLEHGCRLVR